MPERTTVTQVVQVGAENTAGTAVAANRLLPSINLATGIDGSFTQIRSGGFKFPVDAIIGKEWTTAKVSGQPTYDELAYLLSACVNHPTPTQQASTTAYLWNFQPSSTSEDTIKTLTVEQGSALRAHRFAYGIVNEFGLKGDRDKVEVSGAMLGQLFTDNVTLTASPTAVAQVPMLPKHFDVWVDNTSGALGTTKLTRVLNWEVMLKNRFGPLWVVDSSRTSWAANVELPVDLTIKLKLEADAQGMGFLTDMRSATTKFIRIKATSDQNAGTAIPYSLTMDFATKISETPKELSDQDGVYAVEFTFSALHNSAWGRAFTWALINRLTTL